MLHRLRSAYSGPYSHYRQNPPKKRIIYHNLVDMESFGETLSGQGLHAVTYRYNTSQARSQLCQSTQYQPHLDYTVDNGNGFQNQSARRMRCSRLLTSVDDFELWTFNPGTHRQSALHPLATRQACRPGPLYVPLLGPLDPYKTLTPCSMARDDRSWSHSSKPCTGTTDCNPNHTRRLWDQHQQPWLPRRRFCGKQPDPTTD
jgi:hypothetical protein